MNISIFGLGYVGSVSMGCLSKGGHKVIGVDIDSSKVNSFNEGVAPIVEPGIDDLIEQGSKNKLISATESYNIAIKGTDISFICVGTPSSEDGNLDMTNIMKVSEGIGTALSSNKKRYHTIVIRSTVHPGTNKRIGQIISEYSGKKIDEDFGIVSNPEFLRESTAIDDYYNPPMIVCASTSSRSMVLMEELYSDIAAPFFSTSIEVAEIIKCVNNSFHALKVCFANEIGNICKKLDIDSYEVMDLFTADTKLNLSSYYLKPGFAYGGSCLPKDLKALNTIALDNGLNSPLLASVEKSNDNQKMIALDMITKKNKKNIGFFGLSFKAGTDDLRNSPSVYLVRELIQRQYNIKIFDSNLKSSRLVGQNKDQIEIFLPQINDLLEEEISTVVEFSELMVICNNDPIFQELLSHNDKQIVDLARITSSKLNNYEGICW
jgi:GDP-mannose 6-dehydrogenase